LPILKDQDLTWRSKTMKSRLFRLLIVVTSLAAMAVALGAGQRWS